MSATTPSIETVWLAQCATEADMFRRHRPMVVTRGFRDLIDSDAAYVSKVDPREPQTDSARYSPDRQWTATLTPGDALCLPPGWFHDVAAPHVSISVDVRFESAINLPQRPTE